MRWVRWCMFDNMKIESGSVFFAMAATVAGMFYAMSKTSDINILLFFVACCVVLLGILFYFQLVIMGIDNSTKSIIPDSGNNTKKKLKWYNRASGRIMTGAAGGFVIIIAQYVSNKLGWYDFIFLAAVVYILAVYLFEYLVSKNN